MYWIMYYDGRELVKIVYIHAESREEATNLARSKEGLSTSPKQYTSVLLVEPLNLSYSAKAVDKDSLKLKREDYAINRVNREHLGICCESEENQPS